MKKFRFNSVTSITFKIIEGFFLFINNIKLTDLIMMYFFWGVLIVVFFKDANTRAGHGGGAKAIRIVLNYKSFHLTYSMMHDIFCIYIPVFA